MIDGMKNGGDCQQVTLEFSKRSQLRIDGKASWRLDTFFVFSKLKKRGGSLYLLIPQQIVESFSLKEEQKVAMAALTAETGAGVGLFIYFGNPVLIYKVCRIIFEVSPPSAADELLRIVAEKTGAIFYKVEPSNNKARCEMEIIEKNEMSFLDARHLLIKESRKRGIEIDFLSAYSDTFKSIPLDIEAIKCGRREAEGIEVKWVI